MPKPDVSAQRKAQILGAAREIFARQPLNDVKMLDIARKAGLSIGGLYWYFKSKEEIINALLQQNAEAQIAALETLRQMDTSALDRLKTLFEIAFASTQELSQLYLTGAKYQAMSSPNPQARAGIAKIAVGFHTGIAAIIAQGIERGEIAPVNPDDATSALVGAYEGLMLLWVMSPQTMRIKEAMQTAAQLLLSGLAAQK